MKNKVDEKKSKNYQFRRFYIDEYLRKKISVEIVWIN